MPEAFLGLSAVGWILVILTLTVFGLVQPIWSMIDCVESDRDRDTKVLVGVLLFFTWGLGSVCYGVFFAGSKALRAFTLGGVAVISIMMVASFGTCVSAVVTQAEQAAEDRSTEKVEATRRLAEYSPSAVAPGSVSPFRALHILRGEHYPSTVSVADFTLSGAVLKSARSAPKNVRHVAHDPDAGRTFAITSHEFGAISPGTGELIEIGVDPSFDFHWPKGVVWDAGAKRAVVMTSHVDTRFYAYDPVTSEWTSVAKLPGGGHVGLAYLHDQELFFSVRSSHDAIHLDTLVRFNRSGASVGQLLVSPPIPLAKRGDLEHAQIQASSGKLVVLLPGRALETTRRGPDRLFMIDPHSGKVGAADPRQTAVADSGDSPT